MTASPKVLKDGTNLDVLAKAVAVAETSGCTAGTALTHNNCVGVQSWDGGYRHPKTYAKKEDSIAEFKTLWATNYQRFPDYTLAKRYTGGDSTRTWLKTVKITYNSLSTDS